MAKKQTKTRQHPDADLLLFESHSLLSFTLSSKIEGDIPKNVQKTI